MRTPVRSASTSTADPGSLQVIEGTGGVQALGEDDKVEIKQTIEDEVLGTQPIEFRSTGSRPWMTGAYGSAGSSP